MSGAGRPVEPRAFEAAFHLVSEAAAFLDARDAVVSANAAFLKLFGDSAPERSRLPDAFAPEERPRVEAFLREARRWSEASAASLRLQGLTAYPVDLWAHQFVPSQGERLLLLRARSAAGRLEAERLHEAAVAAAHAFNAASTWAALAEGAEGAMRRSLPRMDGAAWLRREGRRWVVAHAGGVLAARWPGPAAVAGEPVWEGFAREGDSVLIADARLELDDGRPEGHPWPSSSLVVSPVAVRGRTEGLLVTTAPGQGEFTLEDLRCLDAVAREMGSAIARLEDHEALARSHARLVEALDAKDELLTRVRRLNAELEEFALWTTHDLREPLRGLATLADLLALEVDGSATDEAQALARQLSSSATDLKERIRALHEFHRSAKDSGRREETSVESLVRDAAAEVEGVEVALRAEEDGLRVGVDPERARLAVRDVLRFAAGEAGERVRLDAGRAPGRRVALAVDAPRGWSSRKSELAFRVLDGRSSLALARRVALQHSGGLAFEAAENGTRLVLLLPAAGHERADADA